MAKGNNATSYQNFSFEKELLHRISHSHPILFPSLPLASSLFTSSQPSSPFLSENFAGGSDQLLRTIYDRLSWTDIGSYFSTLINGMGLGQNISDSGHIYSEPNLANQFVYDMMLRIPGERTGNANLLEGKKAKKGDDTFEESNSVRTIDNILWKPKENSSRGKSTILANYKSYYSTPLEKNETFYKSHYYNYLPHPQYLEPPNNYKDNRNSSIINSNYYGLLRQNDNLGFNLQTLSRLSWTDIGSYFSTLINGMGLGQNISDSGHIYSEPNLANQFVYDMMLRIPGERTGNANLLEGKKAKKGDDTFEESNSVRTIDNILWKPKENSSRGKSTILANYKSYYSTPLEKNETFYKSHYYNYLPHPQYLEPPNNYKDNRNSSIINSNYYGLLRQNDNLGFNLQTLSRLSWTDIGSYFSTLINGMGLGQNISDSGHIYSEPNLANQFVYDMMLGIPGGVEDGTLNEKQKNRKDETDVSYASDHSLSRLEKNITSSKLNIISDNSFDEMLNRYNADAITLGPNIIFATDKFNTYTPQGMALLVHELTHAYQLKKLHELPVGDFRNAANRLNDSWEQEALDNEQFAYNFLTYTNKLNQIALPYSNIDAIYDNHMVSIGSPYHNADSYDTHADYDKSSLNYAKTSIDLTTIIEMISKKLNFLPTIRIFFKRVRILQISYRSFLSYSYNQAHFISLKQEP